MPFEPPQLLNPNMLDMHVDKNRVYPAFVTVNAVELHGIIVPRGVVYIT